MCYYVVVTNRKLYKGVFSESYTMRKTTKGAIGLGVAGLTKTIETLVNDARNILPQPEDKIPELARDVEGWANTPRLGAAAFALYGIHNLADLYENIMPKPLKGILTMGLATFGVAAVQQFGGEPWGAGVDYADTLGNLITAYKDCAVGVLQVDGNKIHAGHAVGLGTFVDGACRSIKHLGYGLIHNIEKKGDMKAARVKAADNAPTQ